jgi:hypothetical protein
MRAAPIHRTVGVYERPGPLRAGLARWRLTGFVAGAVSTLLFHQGVAALLHALELTARVPYSLQPTSPFGVPVLLSIAFWGALWGAFLAAVLRNLDGARLVAAATILGAIAPTLVAWFVVAPLKGQPPAGGWAPAAMLAGPLVNAAWGLGTGLGLLKFGRYRPARPGAAS